MDYLEKDITDETGHCYKCWTIGSITRNPATGIYFVMLEGYRSWEDRAALKSPGPRKEYAMPEGSTMSGKTIDDFYFFVKQQPEFQDAVEVTL